MLGDGLKKNKLALETQCLLYSIRQNLLSELGAIKTN
jgi:hypothetical protein